MKKKNILYLSIGLFLSFILLLLLIIANTTMSIDNITSDFFRNNQNTALYNISVWIGILLGPEYIVSIIFIISVILFFYSNKRRESFFLALAALLSAGLTLIVKEIIKRPRPLIQLFIESGYSFPSGHSALAIIMIGSLAYLFLKSKNITHNKIMYSISIFFIFIIGVSRIYLNVHFLSDVIAGYLLGLSVLIFTIYLDKINIFQKLANQFRPK